MGKINIPRVLIGGIVAGLVADILNYVIDGMLLGSRWAEEMTALRRATFSTSEWIWSNLLGLVSGIALIWIYAAIRPRFGAGVKTAIFAGVAVWVVGSLVPNLGFMWVGGLFSHRLTMMTTVGAVVEVVVAAIAGAALYKEPAS